jgi:ribonucleoside-diphosphate reductase alpha chain
MVDIYSEAWKRGLKTTYYLHVKPRHTAEQSTVKVNKAETGDGSARKVGFGFAKKQEVSV